MTRLDELFPDGPTPDQRRAVLDDHHTVRRLNQLFGDRRAPQQSARPSDPAQLALLVEQAAAQPGVGQSSTFASAGGSTHRRRRFDPLTSVAVVIAVLALGVTGVVGGVQIATASPADDALTVLTEDERTIESVEAALTAAHESLTADVTAADAAAEQLQSVLSTMRDFPDPEDIPPGESIAPDDARRLPIADSAALTTARKAVDAYRRALAGLSVPELPGAYARRSTDEGSLDQVGAAIDAAEQRLVELDVATASVRDLRDDLRARTQRLGKRLAAFTKTFPAAAQLAIDDSPAVGQELTNALTEAARVVAATDLTTPDGGRVLRSYREALIAVAEAQVYQERVQADLERERREQEQRERWEREQRNQNNDEEQDPGTGEEESNGDEEQPPEPPTTEPPAEPEQPDAESE